MQYCVFSLKSFAIHLHLALDHKMLLEVKCETEVPDHQLEMCRSQGINYNGPPPPHRVRIYMQMKTSVYQPREVDVN